MSDLVKWILSDFWRFIGAMFLVYAIGEAGAMIVGAARSKPWPDKPSGCETRATDRTNTLNPDPAMGSIERRESR